MIYVTGDLHGDIKRFKSPAMKVLKKSDVLLVCGDFGFVWHMNSEEEKALKWIGKRKYQTLFVEGTHEDFRLLEQFPKVELYGGVARQLGKNVYQLLRGEIYEIEGKRFFTLGGGDLDEDEDRVEGINWLVGEELSEEDIENAVDHLNQVDWEVDYIISHDIVSQTKSFLSMQNDQYLQMHTFFDELNERVRYKHWYFGHFHQDKAISSTMTAVYQKVLPIGGTWRK